MTNYNKATNQWRWTASEWRHHVHVAAETSGSLKQESSPWTLVTKTVQFTSQQLQCCVGERPNCGQTHSFKHVCPSVSNDDQTEKIHGFKPSNREMSIPSDCSLLHTLEHLVQVESVRLMKISIFLSDSTVMHAKHFVYLFCFVFFKKRVIVKSHNLFHHQIKMVSIWCFASIVAFGFLVGNGEVLWELIDSMVSGPQSKDVSFWEGGPTVTNTSSTV